MSEKDGEKDGKQGVSKVKLALGAASLFLFIVGLKRTFQMEEPESAPPAERPERERPERERPRPRRRKQG
jgi:hypothetical protein